MTRRERTRAICRRVIAKVREVAPRGLGRWGPAWDLVAEPSDAFLDALDAFLDSDTPETRQDLQHAADALVEAWRQAGQRWVEAGRPGSHPPRAPGNRVHAGARS